jgi:hypothetical protein
MKIELSDPEHVDGLLTFLEKMGIPVSPSDVRTVVTLPEAGDDVVSRLEVEIYLKLWLAKNPTRRAEIVEETVT